MNEKELLELLKGIIALATPLNSNGVEITSLDTPIADTGLDSLDLLMVGIYLSDVYGVSEEIAKTMDPVTIRDMLQFMQFHSTKQPVSVEATLNDISN